MTPEQRIAQRFGMHELTALIRRCPNEESRPEFAEACLLWDVPPSASWSRDPFIPFSLLTASSTSGKV